MRRKQSKHPDSFHASIRPLLVMAQICGLVPVKGIFGSKIRYTWKNPIHLYGAVISFVTLFFDSCYTVDNFKTTFGIDVFAPTVFYTVCFLTTLFFLQIATQFSSIAEGFARVEKSMKHFGYPKALGLKIQLFLYTFFILAAVEHGTMVYLNVNSALEISSESNQTKGFGYSFYIVHFPAISMRLSYSAILTLILFWVNLICTFNWNYLDFFLITMSLELSARFSQINSKLKDTCLAKQGPEFFIKITEDYNCLARLTKKMDQNFGKIILTSFFSNMYHLSLQLVRSLKLSGTLFRMMYFYFSLFYLISRLLLVLFFASKIHEESKKPAAELFSLENPCKEAIRLHHQALTDDIALTGCKFFIITKKFFVSVIGTIMTYQAFLLQFNSLFYKDN